MKLLPKIFCLLLTLAAVCACQTDKSKEQTTKETIKQQSEASGKNTADESKEIIRALYQAVNHEQYKYAYNLWENEGAASDLSFDEFVKGYENTEKAEVEFTDDIEIHGAAGSLYAEVPVHVEAQLKSGEKQVFTGTYVLRKSNINPEETPNNWHIYDATLTLQPIDSAK